MITRLELSDFRGIAGWHPACSLKPITLVFGPNSAGKSTLTNALIYFREILERHNVDADVTRLGGDSVDLGGFAAMVHNHDLDRVIRVGVTFDVTSDLVEYSPFPPEDAHEQEESVAPSRSRSGARSASTSGSRSGGRTASTSRSQSTGTEPTVERPPIRAICDAISARVTSASVDLGVAWSHADRVPQVVDYRVGMNGHGLARIEASLDGRSVRLVELDLQHELLRGDADGASLIEQYVEWTTVQESGGLGIVGARSALPVWGRRQQFKTSVAIDDKDGWGSLQVLLDVLLAAPGRMLREKLTGLRYVGPLREVPRRDYQAPRSIDESRWATGMGAWDALSREPALRESVSTWLSGPLGARLVVDSDVRWEVPEDVGHHATDFLASLGGERAVEPQPMSRPDVNADVPEATDISGRLAASRHRAHLVLRRTNLPESANVSALEQPLHPRDVGVGISQVVPVVAAALDPFVHVEGRRVPVEGILIEQPELHIHPAMQVGLGDLFIEAAKTRQVIVETHSEHLVLRLLRRIRETTDRKASDGRELTPEDLCVLYVEPSESGYTRIREMRVDERGEFVDAWPEGFFEERDPELFG